MYTRPAGNAVNFNTVFPGGDGYAPPAGGSVVLDFGVVYAPPAGDLVILQFGGLSEYTRPPGYAVAFVWFLGGPRVVWFVVNC